MTIDTDPKKIEEVLTRGVETIYPTKEELEKTLMSGKKLQIYNGIDPTGKLHIGHSVVLLKLRYLQDLGHEIIVLIGGFTATIGDPTDKKATRQPLTIEQVEKNTADYKEIIGKILDLSKPNVRFVNNKEWMDKLTPKDMLDLASQFTVSRLLERDMFQERIKTGKEIHVHEFLYPVFQAYDSVAMDVDMEIGGNDQVFNMLAGRTLLKRMKDKEKFVLATKLLTDSSGTKMGKTEGNAVNLDDPAQEMYGKVMSWPDEFITISFEILTQVPMSKVEEVKTDLLDGKNPKLLKSELAKEIVKMYHGAEAAEKAEEYFVNTFQKKEIPDDLEEIKVVSGVKLVDVLSEQGIVKSKSDFRRLVDEGAIGWMEGEKISDPNFVIEQGGVLKVGKKRFVKIIF